MTTNKYKLSYPKMIIFKELTNFYYCVSLPYIRVQVNKIELSFFKGYFKSKSTEIILSWFIQINLNLKTKQRLRKAWRYIKAIALGSIPLLLFLFSIRFLNYLFIITYIFYLKKFVLTGVISFIICYIQINTLEFITKVLLPICFEAFFRVNFNNNQQEVYTLKKLIEVFIFYCFCLFVYFVSSFVLGVFFLSILPPLFVIFSEIHIIIQLSLIGFLYNILLWIIFYCFAVIFNFIFNFIYYKIEIYKIKFYKFLK